MPQYRAGVWLAGEDVTVICDGGLVHLQHRGVLIATHARRHPLDKQQAVCVDGQRPTAATSKRPSSTAPSVTRKVDSSGNVCFAGTNYHAGTSHIRRQIQVAVVGDTVEISSASSSSAPTPSATTAPANTAPSPTPAADPAAPTPPNPSLECQAGTGIKLSAGYRNLTGLTRCGAAGHTMI